MKICVTAYSNDYDSQIDPRFGRCSFFVLIDPDTMQIEITPNLASGASGGAGIQAAQILVNKNVDMLITGNVGPKAFGALSSSGIKVITGVMGSVRTAIEKYKKGELNITSSPTVRDHHGFNRS